VLYPEGRILNNGGRSSIRIGRNTHIRGELLTFGHGGRISIGEYCYIGEQTRVWSGTSIRIGDRVLVSHLVNVFDNDTHPLDPRARHAQFREIITRGHPQNVALNDRPVVIEDDALVCASVTILSGVTVGRAAVIGAGSVVTRDVPAATLVAGNPARVVRHLDVSAVP
jgi:acetyltransferase-like isoleucine patch superfamily enzyme